jgi:hypothetical protein
LFRVQRLHMHPSNSLPTHSQGGVTLDMLMAVVAGHQMTCDVILWCIECMHAVAGENAFKVLGPIIVGL